MLYTVYILLWFTHILSQIFSHVTIPQNHIPNGRTNFFCMGYLTCPLHLAICGCTPSVPICEMGTGVL